MLVFSIDFCTLKGLLKAELNVLYSKMQVNVFLVCGVSLLAHVFLDSGVSVLAHQVNDEMTCIKFEL